MKRKNLFSITLLLMLPLSIMLVVANAAHADYREVDVKEGGSVIGKVTFKGALPDNAIEKIAIAKNPEVCGEGYREVVWVDVKKEALRGAFVFIDKITKGKKWPSPEGNAYMIDQKDCRFTPAAQVVRRGPVTIRNRDRGVLHNVNLRELIGVEKGRVVKRSMFNLGQPKVGEIVENIAPRRSMYLSLICEAHNFMSGFILAPEHPYAVVVNDKGEFNLDNVPPGRYTLKVWHPTLGVKKSEVTVPAKGTAKVDFEF